jgi:hypothetical protein
MYGKNKKNHGEYESVVCIFERLCVVLTLYARRWDCLCPPGCE